MAVVVTLNTFLFDFFFFAKTFPPSSAAVLHYSYYRNRTLPERIVNTHF